MLKNVVDVFEYVTDEDAVYAEDADDGGVKVALLDFDDGRDVCVVDKVMVFFAVLKRPDFVFPDEFRCGCVDHVRLIDEDCRCCCVDVG